jgi:hypothetical protein
MYYGKRAGSWVGLTLGLLLITSPSSGQVIDDGFDAGCCVSPVVALPSFPFIAIDGIYACLSDCHPAFTSFVHVRIPPPAMILCDIAQPAATISIILPNDVLSGFLVMKYARTWTAAAPNGKTTQVWRFLVNGDIGVLVGSFAGQCMSILPPCWNEPGNPLGLGNIHWEGHIDYALTEPLEWSFSLSLNHLHGLYTHDVGSCALLTGPNAAANSHPFESYHIVAPGNFIFTDDAPGGNPLIPPSGPLLSDAVRRSLLTPPLTYSCVSEIHLQTGGHLSTVFTPQCLGSPCASPTWTCTCLQEQSLNGASCYPGGPTLSFSGLNTGPSSPLPPSGIVAHAIGRWDPAMPVPVYPWASVLTVYVGAIQTPPNIGTNNPDPCNATPPMYVPHVVTGVATSDPGDGSDWSVGLFNSTLCTCSTPLPGIYYRSCVDLCNVLLWSTGLLPGYGCLAGSDLVLNLNHGYGP